MGQCESKTEETVKVSSPQNEVKKEESEPASSNKSGLDVKVADDFAQNIINKIKDGITSKINIHKTFDDKSFDYKIEALKAIQYAYVSQSFDEFYFIKASNGKDKYIHLSIFSERGGFNLIAIQINKTLDEPLCFFTNDTF